MITCSQLVSRFTTTFAAGLWMIVTICPLCDAREDDAQAIALLRGVEASRANVSSAKITLEIEYLTPQPAITVRALVEAEGRKVRFEIFPGDVPGQVIIHDQHEFTEYRQKPHEDVNIYDSDEAIGVRGAVAFDPRVLGLSALMPATVTVRDCLWYENADELSLVGRERVNGVVVWRVKAVRGNTVSEYWIEEPSFRVHKRTLGDDVQIDSSFEGVPDDLPFPGKVVAHQKGEREMKRIYWMTSMELNVRIPPTRFSMASIALPVNTAIVDYRIKRTVGYWTLDGVSPQPGPTGGAAADEPSYHARSRLRSYLIVGNIVVLGAILTVIARWRLVARRGR